MRGQYAPKQEQSSATSGGGAKTVLLVDDTVEDLSAMSEILQRLGLLVIAYDNANSALFTIREGVGIDLVISDLRMQVMDGLDFVEALRRSLPNVPVILLTGHGDVESYFKAFSLGIFEYLLKPVDKAVLKRVIHAAFEQKLRGQAATGGEEREAGQAGDVPE